MHSCLPGLWDRSDGRRSIKVFVVTEEEERRTEHKGRPTSQRWAHVEPRSQGPKAVHFSFFYGRTSGCAVTQKATPSCRHVLGKSHCLQACGDTMCPQVPVSHGDVRPLALPGNSQCCPFLCFPLPLLCPLFLPFLS